MEYNYTFNKYQSTLEELHFDSYPEEVKEQFLDFLNNVPFIKFLVSKDRPHAKDLPKDEDGKIIDVLNGKKDCSKILAFCITKYINPNAEINDIFDTIRED